VPRREPAGSAPCGRATRHRGQSARHGPCRPRRCKPIFLGGGFTTHQVPNPRSKQPRHRQAPAGLSFAQEPRQS